MPKVIQVRDVPDDVHEALTTAAQQHGQSLTRFVLGELEQVARRAQVARDNASLVRRTQAEIGAPVDRQAILAALHEGREE